MMPTCSNGNKAMVGSQGKEKMFSVAEVAAELGVTSITVRRWLKAKLIHGFRQPS